MLRRRRLGFLVDAALVGFSVGTGFALVENVDYLRIVRDGSLALWLVRGFGPAILHGAMTGLFAMLAKSLSERHPERRTARAGPPALAAAVVLHSAFNHFPMPPILATCVLLIALPVVVTMAFERSERATREWVGEGLDLDVELLNLVRVGAFRADAPRDVPRPAEGPLSRSGGGRHVLPAAGGTRTGHPREGHADGP